MMKDHFGIDIVEMSMYYCWLSTTSDMDLTFFFLSETDSQSQNELSDPDLIATLAFVRAFQKNAFRSPSSSPCSR